MPFYRRAARAPIAWYIVKTLLHLAITWVLLLGVVPWLVVRMQERLEWHALFFPPQPLPAMVIFTLASLVALWAALALAIVGQGTPARIDAPRTLVVIGPYAWVRNPMVVSGLVQSGAVALYRGSILLVILILLTGATWHFTRRRDEESDLQRAFGRDYELYCRSVRCWMPRRRRWRPTPAEERSPIGSADVALLSGRRRRR